MISFLQTWGMLGLFIGSFLAATVVPFSSDALLIGMLLSDSDPLQCLLWATLGNWLGGITSFGIGWLGKWEWIEKWFRVKKSTLEKQHNKVERWGDWLSLLTWLPIVGDVFAIALGFYRCNPTRCIIFMLIGKFFRFALWAVLFYCTGWTLV